MIIEIQKMKRSHKLIHAEGKNIAQKDTHLWLASTRRSHRTYNKPFPHKKNY